jgi:tripartite-type tricarboxylate transporter receptor subunit TctC
MKRLFIVVLAFTMVLAITPQASSKSSIDYPKDTIKIIVPYSAGGSTSLMARIIATELSKKLGEAVVVVNKPGGSGAVGMFEVSKSKPDGYTLIITALGPAVLTPLNTNVGYTNKDFAAISHCSSLSSLIFVRSDSGFNTLDDLVKKAEANYGKLTYSTPGAGLTGHVACELFMEKLGKPGLFTMVPFNSGVEATTAVLGRHIDFSFGDAGDTADYVKMGTLKVIAVASEKRDPFVPDVPTFKELGYDLVIGPWWGFVAPARTPKEIIEFLDGKIRDCLELPEVIDKFNKVNQPVFYLNHTDFTTKWTRDFKSYKRVLEKIKLGK